MLSITDYSKDIDVIMIVDTKLPKKFFNLPDSQYGKSVE